MHAALQRRIQRDGWDRAAPAYDAAWARQIEPAQDALLQLAALRPGERVLDVACGTGLVTRRAAALVGPTGEVTATDISEAMVDATAARLAALPLRRARVFRGDAERLEVDGDSMDAVLCSLGLMYVPAVPAALAEFRRVLRPGGRAAVSVWGARGRCGWAGVFPVVEARVRSEVCPRFFDLGTGDTLRGRLAESGFERIAVARLDTILHYPSARAACAAAFAGGPVALAYSRFDPCLRAGLHADYLETIERYRRGAGYHVPGQFVVALAARP